MNPLTRSLVGAILESMDHSTPISAKSACPSDRFRSRAKERNALRIIVSCLVSVAIAITALAAISH
jgi:hypothetical protein